MLAQGDAAPNFSVRPIFGVPISAPPPQPCVLSFVGSLASPYNRRWLAAFQDNHADFDRRGVMVAAVAHCGVRSAQDFVPRYHLLYPLAADPDGAIADLYGVGRDRWLLASLPGVVRSRGALAHGVGWGEGSVRRLPAVFYIDTDGTLRAVQYGRSIADTPDIEALLRCAAS